MHPHIHNIIDKGKKVGFYFEMEDFAAGYILKGFGEDIKIDSTHISDYGKMAFIGDKKWYEFMGYNTDFFTSSEVKYFDSMDKESAKKWILK